MRFERFLTAMFCLFLLYPSLALADSQLNGLYKIFLSVDGSSTLTAADISAGHPGSCYFDERPNFSRSALLFGQTKDAMAGLPGPVVIPGNKVLQIKVMDNSTRTGVDFSTWTNAQAQSLYSATVIKTGLTLLENGNAMWSSTYPNGDIIVFQARKYGNQVIVAGNLQQPFAAPMVVCSFENKLN
jgi:hypothetical protein